MRPQFKSNYVSDRRLYLDRDGRVVGEDDPIRASLLVPAGGTIPRDRAIQLGLVKEDGETTMHADSGEPQEESSLADLTDLATAKRIMIAMSNEIDELRSAKEKLTSELRSSELTIENLEDKVEKLTDDLAAAEKERDELKAATPSEPKPDEPKADQPVSDKADKPAKDKADKAPANK